MTTKEKDDMLLAAEKKSDIQKLKGLLSIEFEMKDLGATKKFWEWRSTEIEVIRSYSCHGRGIFRKFYRGLEWLLLSPLILLEKEYMSHVPYVSAVKNLMYAMVCTKPDLAHAVSVASRFMGDPGKEHWQTVKRIFRYLRGTSDIGLSYGGDSQCLVSGYSDSDYAGDVDNRRSMTGYVFTLGGSVVSWKAIL
ncbi:secreted RxLR effector protein 161-like [Impatiens glandulifera]|uniref:secreted RxLR effector protein 161-like n=1 Tax=Impatiens glandulifera TaxID=253017 RepID=UPI001FB0F418|nr:secreted RxLR effector protein 161-like [Impatiens glandulifera]